MSLEAAQKLCARIGEQLAGDEEGRDDLLAGLRMYMGQPDMVRPACICYALCCPAAALPSLAWVFCCGLCPEWHGA